MIRRTAPRPDPDVVDGLREFCSADISDMLNRMYTMGSNIRNLINNQRLVGPACTVKVYPGDNLMVHRVLDIAKPGDVVVVDCCGNDSHAVMGDLVSAKAKHRGIAGFVIDGLIRDQDDMKEIDLPVYARGVTPLGPLHRGPGEINYAVSCGGVVVNPGDIVVADTDGVVVVRHEYAAELLERQRQNKERMEKYVADVRRGVFSNDWVTDALAEAGCLEND
ncbi:RraA family protein [Oceanibium sediminis]|uniref:RraA family protein n=1 Tax=Oceanibium sediminis TaxID=2026339 RepID=UPI001300AFC1|nr:RraA family protein [Oceanibium sediminis]